MATDWYPGADRSRPAWTDGGSILGGKPKMLWHDTETSGLPSYSTGSFPHFTVDPTSGKIWQHIPVSRAARALKNLNGGCQTNRWRVVQVEIIGRVNKIPYHKALGDLARWARVEHGVPATCGVRRLPYDDSYGSTSVRLSCAQWDTYTGHLYHMSAPENDHGDPGDPFPMAQILAAASGPTEEEDDVSLTDEQARQLQAIYDAMIVPGTRTGEDTMDVLFARVRNVEGAVGRLAAAQGIDFTPVDSAQVMAAND